MNTKTNTVQTSVQTFSEIAPYHSDPLALFHALCGNKKHNILLESAEIDKKHQLKSLLLTNAAVKIVCQGNIVTLTFKIESSLI